MAKKYFYLHQILTSPEIHFISFINPLPALTYQNVLDLNVACRTKCTQTYWHVRKFKCLL
jgi:hypothetical protein